MSAGIAVEAKIRTFLNPVCAAFRRKILMPFTSPYSLFPIPDSSSAIYLQIAVGAKQLKVLYYRQFIPPVAFWSCCLLPAHSAMF